MHNFTANDPIYCYFDIETTGLEPYRNSIIEIAMIIDSKQCAEISQRIPEFDKIDKQFEALIRTETPISPRAKDKHKITDTMLQDKENFSTVFRRWLKYIKSIEKLTQQKVLLISHYAEFDVSFLDKECHDAKIDEFKQMHFACSLNGVKNTYGRLHRLSLQALYAQYVNKQDKQSHRAMDDCLMLMQLAHHLPNNEEFYNTLRADQYTP